MKETDLRWQLRQVPRELDLPRDLWPAIESGIQHRPARVSRRWPAALAAAATLVLAAGLFWRSDANAPIPPAGQLEARIVSSEAREITDEYQAALRQFDGATVAPQAEPSIAALDRSVAQIQSAIVADPDSVFLLEQLRRTYSQRLQMTQRAVAG
ncbi:MAG: hypothetical protein ABI588_05985, partial [Arenimonas sp.]